MNNPEDHIRHFGKRVAEVNAHLRDAYQNGNSSDRRAQMMTADQLGFAETVLRQLIEQFKHREQLHLELIIGRHAIMPFDVFQSTEAVARYVATRKRGSDVGITSIPAGSTLRIDGHGGRGETFAIGSSDRFLRLGTVARTLSENGLLVPVDSSPTASDS